LAPWRVSLVALAIFFISLAGKKVRVLIFIAALLLGSTVMSLRQQSLANNAIRSFMDQPIDITAQVATDPILSAPKVSGSYFAIRNYSFIARATFVGAGGENFQLRIPIRIVTPNKVVANLLPGQQIHFRGTAVASKEARVAALVFVKGDIEIRTQASRWAKSLASIRNGLRINSGPGDAGALIPGMVLGDTSKQSVAFKADMKRSGLTHLVAVSGANFAIVSAFVLWGMQFFIRSLRWRLGATAIFLASFIALVRPSPSVLRAAAMAAVLLVAKGSRRPSDSLPALGFAIAAVVIGDPWQARDAGFALSVLATAGLLLFAPRIISWLSKYLPKLISEALAPPIAATIFCSPVLIAIAGYLAPMSVIANLFAAPAVAPITIIGFIAALISPIAPVITRLLIWFIHFPAAFITWTAHWAAQFPVLKMSSAILIGSLIALWFTRTLVQRHWKKYVAIALCFLLFFTWIGRWPGGQWSVANCDIGQGDSSVINLGNHRAIVIDVGPDAALEDACLKALGIREIPLLILSHFHADHVEGLPGLLKRRDVGQVWVSNNTDPIFESVRVQSWLKGIEIVVATRGMQSTISNIAINVLWPQVTTQQYASNPGDGSSINNSSIAAMITSPDFSLFAAGDLEPPVQELLRADVAHVDIYKVCHHGSKYQDPEFMAHLSPAIAMISVGTGNTYGHPAPQTVRALTRLGARVVRTDTDGAIAIRAKNHLLSIKLARSGIHIFRLG
jgi:competence protein ComEC